MRSWTTVPEDAVKMQFDDLAQQREADTLGMWVFLATEVLLFGGLFLGYTVYRQAYPKAFAAASHHLDIVLGTLNTAILLTSSLTMALAVLAVQANRRRLLLFFLSLTALLGAIFLSIKFFEYHKEMQEGLVPLRGFDFHFKGHQPEKAQMFFNFYFAMTGLHALHLTVGILITLVMIGLASRMKNQTALENHIEIAGLYWHLIDVIWVFLFPLLYLIERHG